MENKIDLTQHTIIDCENLEQFIVDFLDDQLPTKTRLSFLEHIEECEHCNDYLKGYQKTISLSKAAFEAESAVEKVAMPEDLVNAILAAKPKI